MPTSCHDDDRNLRTAANLLTHIQAIEVRQSEIQDDDVRAAGQFNSRSTGVGPLNLEPVPSQTFNHRLSHRLIVLDQGHSHPLMVPGQWAHGQEQRSFPLHSRQSLSLLNQSSLHSVAVRT